MDIKCLMRTKVSLVLAIATLMCLNIPTFSQTKNGFVTSAKPLRVFFVGNSYTYENNLPFVFEALADPVRDVEVTMLAAGGAPLRRHIDGGRLLETIRDGRFDVVVAQEQSVLGRQQLFDGISLIDDPAMHHQAVREIAAATRASGARLVLFSTWPRSETPRSLAALHNASVAIAEEAGATVAPVGLVWDRLGGDACEALHLYAGDGSHPATEGTYVAAVVLIRAVLGRMPALRAVPRVPLMDGAAKLNGSFVDIAPSGEGMTALDQAISAVYKTAPRGQFAALPVAPPVPEPNLPSEVIRGRLSPSFLRGEWQGEFATFSPKYQATLTLDLRAESATVRVIHPEEGWPEDDDTTAIVRARDDDGVLTFTYQSKGKNCRVEIRLVRVGNQLRGVVRFVPESGREWVRSTITLVRK